MYRVLYVDDEPGLLEIAKIFLERGREITVETRTSALPALPLLDSKEYDAVISDYQMPGMDGIAFLKKVRGSGNNIPFILFTGKGREEVVIQALNEGADFYLQKGGDPVSQFAELSNKIRYAINSKRAKETLEQKTEELNRFFNSSLDLLCIADTEGYFRRLNPEWEHALGYLVSELEGKKFIDFVHPDDLARTLDEMSRVMARNEILNFENRYRHKDGSYRWIEWRSYPYGDLIYATARDITERKEAQAVLQASEERFRNLYTHMVEGSALHELVMNDKGIPEDYTLIEVNPAFETLLGIPRGSVIGKTSREAYGVSEPPYLEIYARVARTGLAEVFETYFPPLDKHFSISVYSPSSGLFATIFEDITQRKRAEEALVLEKTFIDAIFNSVPGMLYLYDADGHLVRWNKKHELMTGYSTDELSRMQLFDWYKGDEKSRDAVTEGVKTTMQTGFGEAEADLQRKDGTKIPLYFTACPLTIQGKQYFAGIGIDITDRRRAENALRASEEKYRRIVETAIEGIWSMDSEFVTVFVNRKMADMLGYTVDEMLGKKIMEFMDPEELADNAMKLANRRNGINEFYERKFRRKDNSIRWFAVSVTSLKDPAGVFSGSFAMLTDITDRKLAEEELRRKNEDLAAAYEQIAASDEELRQNLDEIAASRQELTISERKYRDLFDNAILGIFRSTPDGRYLDMNPAFARIAGFSSPQEMMAAVRDIQQLYVLPEDRQRLLEMLSSTGQIQNFETEIRRHDGTTIWIAINAKTARDTSGNILWIDGTIEDITTRRNAEMKSSC